jgi:hypothetical protein
MHFKLFALLSPPVVEVQSDNIGLECPYLLEFDIVGFPTCFMVFGKCILVAGCPLGQGCSVHFWLGVCESGAAQCKIPGPST